jgi:acyl dehydratase
MPFHTSVEYALNSRFHGLIASGWLTDMLIWAQFIKQYDPLGDEIIAGLGRKMECPAPVYAGDNISATYEITHMEIRNPYNGLVRLKCHTVNQRDELVFESEADLVMKRKPTNKRASKPKSKRASKR